MTPDPYLRDVNRKEAHIDSQQEKARKYTRELTRAMLDALLSEPGRRMFSGFGLADGSPQFVTPLDWFGGMLGEKEQSEILSILVRLAKGDTDARELNALHLQASAILASIARAYGDLYGPEVAAGSDE